MADYATLREFNEKRRLTDYLAMPVVPSVEMMLAAADRRDVFRPGDRLTDYIVRWDWEPHEKPPHVPEALVAEFGRQRAFEICVLADAWAGCVEGFGEWQRRRGREGSSPFVDSWLKALPVRCPDGGWPETKELATQEHVQYSACVPVVCASDHHLWWREAELAGGFHGPARCVSIMALRARQKESSAALFCSFEELVDNDLLPYVPGYCKDHYFDDEERAALVVAAMWDSAVEAFKNGSAYRAVPSDDINHAARLQEIMGRCSRYRQAWRDFYTHAPYRQMSVRTEHGRLDVEVTDRGVTWEIECDVARSLTRRTQVDLRLCAEARLLDRELERLDASPGVSFAFESFSGKKQE